MRAYWLSPPVAALAIGLAATPAHAGGGGGVTIDLLLPDGSGGFIREDDEDERRFFNLSRCDCSQAEDEAGEATDDREQRFVAEVRETTPGTVLVDELEIWVGTNCLDDEDRIREPECEEIGRVDVLRLPNQVSIDLRQLMFPNSTACDDDEETTRTVYALIDDGDDTFTIAGRLDIPIDTRAPPAPVNPDARGVEGGIQVTWSLPTANVVDIDHFEVLCADSAGQPPASADASRAQYTPPPALLCGLEGSDPGPGPDAGPMDAGVDAAPDAGMDAGADAPADAGAPSPPATGGLNDLDPRFHCGRAASTATQLRIGGLSNGEEYRVVLLAVDRAGNISPVALPGVFEPRASVDFWEDYTNRGGGAEGGFCLATSTFGDGSPLTRALRDLRDDTLAQYAWGRAVTAFYYAHVAWMGEHIERHLALRLVVGAALAPVAGLAALWVYTGAVTKLLIALALALLWRWRRRARLSAARTGARTTTRPRARAGARARPGAAAAGALALPGRLAVPVRLGGLVRARAVGAATAAAALLLASPAGAQVHDPYWASFDGDVRQAPMAPRKHATLWNVGFKLGPYLPDVDSQFDLGAGEKGPYETFFGGAGVMGLLDVDRFFLFPLGQLGLTGSVGFTGKSGAAFAAADCEAEGAPSPCVPGITIAIDPETGEPVRADGDDTAFRLLPISVGAVYRLTALDDQLHIPVVPYGKLGLAYYIWWVTRPGGGVAEAPTPDCPDLDGCTGNVGRGASLGWQATAGVAIRAERIDPQAAMSLANEYGIDHAGIYAEVTYAQVDGFGAGDKLPVGALTWFAGVNFEF